jgi:hypothetical protein
MKRLFNILLLFCTFSVTAQNTLYYPLVELMASPTINPVFTSSLISAYNADGDAGDYTTYANGTLTNGATATGTPKVGTYSFGLDGTNDYVDCGLNKWNFTDAFSVSGWIYINATGANRCIASSFYDAANTRGWTFRVDNTGKVSLSSWSASGNNSVASLTSVTTSTYQHWVATVASDKTVKIYLNGSLNNTGAFTYFPTYNASSACYIGSQYGFYYFNGNIDALQIWNRELSSTEVTTLYNSGNGRQP